MKDKWILLPMAALILLAFSVNTAQATPPTAPIDPQVEIVVYEARLAQTGDGEWRLEVYWPQYYGWAAIDAYAGYERLETFESGGQLFVLFADTIRADAER